MQSFEHFLHLVLESLGPKTERRFRDSLGYTQPSGPHGKIVQEFILEIQAGVQNPQWWIRLSLMFGFLLGFIVMGLAMGLPGSMPPPRS